MAFCVLLLLLDCWCAAVCLCSMWPACVLLLLLQGFVYLKFDSPMSAQAAAKVLHGRFYNGLQIHAAFQFLQTYNQFFNLQ